MKRYTVQLNIEVLTWVNYSNWYLQQFICLNCTSGKIITWQNNILSDYPSKHQIILFQCFEILNIYDQITCNKEVAIDISRLSTYAILELILNISRLP